MPTAWSSVATVAFSARGPGGTSCGRRLQALRIDIVAKANQRAIPGQDRRESARTGTARPCP